MECPEELPAGETEATLEEEKQQLLNIYAEGGMGGAETAEHLMEKTYITQRQFINGVSAFSQRPFLPLQSADGCLNTNQV